ncbi:Hsp20/alpha crystallin family protein [Candidatus Nitrosotenuis cloacae]|jgi:HSP20 family protein|uniref:Hsp20/alpha crystallin family protein n=1 Tax=Candidatus Nitrosotenuis cloacae TaxID=1603555 RepID=UPI0022812868|nr:Hsp20/alpha crystallin family protein [Candidatus Nitrosotenuis cloacae]
MDWLDIEFSRMPLFQFGDDLEQKILSPLSCIREHESKWILEFDLPLVDKKDIAVYLDSDGMLVVEAKLKETYYDSKAGVRHQFEYFKKAVRLPKNVDADKITVKFTNGRLLITLPKMFRGTAIKVD